MADDQYDGETSTPGEEPRRRQPIEEQLDVVDPLFDLDVDVIEQQPATSPGSFRLFGRTWDLAPSAYIDTDLPDANQNPAGYMLGQLCGLVHSDQRDQFADEAFDAYKREDLGLPALSKITTKLAGVYENREQRRTSKRAGRPTGAR